MAVVELLASFLGNLHTWLPPWNACTPTHTEWGINRSNERSVWGRRATFSLQLQRHDGIAQMTGMLSWMATSFLGKTSQQCEVVELFFMLERNWDVSSSSLGCMKNKKKEDEWEFGGRQHGLYCSECLLQTSPSGTESQISTIIWKEPLSQAMVGSFSHPIFCWKDSQAHTAQEVPVEHAWQMTWKQDLKVHYVTCQQK